MVDPPELVQPSIESKEIPKPPLPESVGRPGQAYVGHQMVSWLQTEFGALNAPANRLAVLISIFSAVAAITSCLFSVLQFQNARQSAALDHRPWIVVHNFVLAHLNPLDDTVLQLGVQNVGKTPATNLSIEGNFKYIPMLVGESEIDFEKRAMSIIHEEKLKVAVQLNSLPPTVEEFFLPSLHPAPTEAEITALKRGNLRLFFFGHITYTGPRSAGQTDFCVVTKTYEKDPKLIAAPGEERKETYVTKATGVNDLVLTLASCDGLYGMMI